MKTMAICASTFEIKKLEHSSLVIGSVVVLSDRAFINLEIFDDADQDTIYKKIKKELLRLEIIDSKLGTGATPNRALVRALSQTANSEEWPIEHVFQYLAPFGKDEIDREAQTLIFDWLKELKISTFGNLRRNLMKFIPNQLKFFAELFEEAEQVLCKKSAEHESATYDIQNENAQNEKLNRQTRSKKSKSKLKSLQWVEPTHAQLSIAGLDSGTEQLGALMGKIQNRLGRQHVFSAHVSSRDAILSGSAAAGDSANPGASDAAPSTASRVPFTVSALRPGAFLPPVDAMDAAVFSNSAALSFPRPSRLFPIPVPVSHFENRLLAPNNQRWTCRTWSPPERISGQKWNERFDRDYFTVDTSEGDVLWIFRDAVNGQLYWHGLFD